MVRELFKRFFFLILFAALTVFEPNADAQPELKKVRMGATGTHVGYLPIQVAHHKGFYREEGLDLEIVVMPANIASAASLAGDIDYNGAVTGSVGSAVHGRPIKVLIVIVARPLLFLVSHKEIREPRDLKATLRGLLFIADTNNRDEIVGTIMKQQKINYRKLAEQMLRYVERVITKDAAVKPEEMQFLVDLMRDNAKVARPVSADQVVDFSFLEKARKDLGLTW